MSARLPAGRPVGQSFASAAALGAVLARIGSQVAGDLFYSPAAFRWGDTAHLAAGTGPAERT